MKAKMNLATLGMVAGIAIVAASSIANAQSSCGRVARTFNDFNTRALVDAKRVGPNDCATVRVATPILTWAQMRDRDLNKPFLVTVSREGGGFSKSYSTHDARLLIPQTLQAGTYEWRVTYYKAGGSETSLARRFIVPSGALYSIPSGATVAQAVADKAHPRVKVGNTSLNQVATLAGNEFGQSYSKYLTMADKFAAIADKDLATVPANDTRESFRQRFGDVRGDEEYSQWLLDLRDISIQQLLEIKTLGYAFHFTGKYHYQNRALERLSRLADWPSEPRDATSHKNQDQANREIFLALAIGMDLFSGALSQPMYAPLQQKLVRKFKQRIEQVDFGSLNTYPRNSHLLTVARYAMEASMHAVGTPGLADDSAKKMLAKHWEMWITTLGSWGENFDGGFGNGEFYGWMNALGVIQGATTARLIAGVDLTKWDLVGKTGEYLIAITPPKILTRQNFGDSAETNNSYQQYSRSMRLLAKLSGKATYDWYWRVDANNTYYSSEELGVEHYLVLALPTNTTTGPNLRNSYHFAEAGFVAMHSATSQQQRTSVFFRSSQFGSFSHNHADQNSFTFTSRGQPMLISAGYYDYSGSPHHQFVTRATRYKNAVTFDNGIGQAERSNTGDPKFPGIPLDSMGTYGRITRFLDNNTWAVASGDASMAYRGYDPSVATSDWKRYLTGAYRTVAYNRREGVVVIYDYATSGPPRQWELNFHTINPPTWQNGQTMVMSNGGVTACLDVYGNNGSAMSVNHRRFRHSQTDQWPTLPPRFDNPAYSGGRDWRSWIGKTLDAGGEAKNRPKQSHVIFYDSNKTAQMTAVTVIRENCRSIPVHVEISGSWASVKINNRQAIVANGTNVSVAAQ